jgi:hypothetical protein
MTNVQDNATPEALAWLLEMELVSTPYVLNSIILNIFASVRGIKDAEFVIDERQKKILVYLKLNWFYEKFKSRGVEAQVIEMLDQILPSFKKRVVFERRILDKALDIMKKKESRHEQAVANVKATANN